MLHFAEVSALVQALKKEGLHVAMETCGYAEPEQFAAILPYVDLFLYDWKETDPLRHKADTGVDNAKILENLRLLDANGASIILRCPIIPGYNDRADHFAGIASLAESLTHVQEIQIEPYHPLGEDKAVRLGRTNVLRLFAPNEETAAAWINAIQKQTAKPVRKA